MAAKASGDVVDCEAEAKEVRSSLRAVSKAGMVLPPPKRAHVASEHGGREGGFVAIFTAVEEHEKQQATGMDSQIRSSDSTTE